jgi:signal transduction histidine kinase
LGDTGKELRVSSQEQAVFDRAHRYLNRAGPRARIALWQLPLVLAIVLAALASPAGWETAPDRPLVLAGLVVQSVACVACLAVPWEKYSDQVALAIPLLDLVSIGLFRNAPGGLLQGLGTLSVFPVIWIAASMRSGAWALAVCFVAPLIIASPTLIDSIARRVPAGANGALLLPILLLIVAVAIRAATAGLRLQERLLRSQQAALRDLLVESLSTERLLTATLDAVHVGIVAVGPDAVPSRWNRRFGELVEPLGWKLSSRGDAGEAALPVFAEDRRTPIPPEQRPLRRAAAGERIDGEVLWLGQGKDAVALSVVARPLAGPEGGAVVAFGDVTALAGAVEDKAELVRTVAHEFRSPLTAVLGNLDLVLESEAIPQSDRLRLEVAQRSAERLLDLASDLVASSSNAIPVRLEAAELGSILSARVDAARLAAVAAGVRLSLEVEGPLWVRVDPLRIGQAVDNLLSNAIKYSPDGGTVTLRACQDDGWVRVEVRDSGMGIAPHERELVFERFFRTSQARRSDIPGVGLGLAISSWIAERHGGRLECDSEPGEGSVFTLLLPAPESAPV